MSESADEIIAVHLGGLERSAAGVNGAIREAWKTLLEDPAARADIAGRLEVAEDALDALGSPVMARIESSGLTGVEIAILVATGVISGGSAAFGKAAVEYIWKRHIVPVLQDPTKQVIGSELPRSEGAEDSAGKKAVDRT